MRKLTDDQLKAAYNAPNGGHLGGLRAVAEAASNGDALGCSFRLRNIASSIQILKFLQASEFVNGVWVYKMPAHYFDEIEKALKETPACFKPEFTYLLTDAIKRLDTLADSHDDDKVKYEASYVSSMIDSFLTFTGLVENEE